MKFSASTSALTRALSKVHGVVPTKSTSPILENMLFDLLNDTLTLTATDMDISLSVALQVKGGEDGRIAIPAKRLLETIRALPELEVVFDIDTTTQKIAITTKMGQYALTGESAKEFPPMPQFKATEELTVDTPSLKKIISRTAFAVSSDELRPAMMGVLFQSKGTELKAVATDGHRLVKMTHKLAKASGLKRDIIIPAKALHLIARTLENSDNTISVSEGHIKLSFDQTVMISRLIDESYPNYESVIPQDNDKTMTIKRDDMVASLRRVALYASATTHQVRFDLSGGKIKMSAQDIDFGGEAKETVECDYSGDALEIGFNSSYLLDILTHLDDDKVTFKFSTPTRAGIVSPAGNTVDDIMMLVMPVRLNT